MNWRVSATALWLAALWVMLWGSITWANVIGGLVVAVIVYTVSSQPPVQRGIDPEERVKVNPVALVWFGFFVLYKLVEANLVLAWEILTPRNSIRQGVVAVRLRTESETAMMVIANVITLTPGTVTIEALGEPPVLYVHVLHLHDVEEIRKDLLRIEELSVRAFGSRAARNQLLSTRTDVGAET